MRAKEELRDLLSQLEGFITTKTVVGEAIHVGDTILLPLVDVSFGAGAGARDKNFDKNGLASAMGGVGAKMSPSAILVVQNGQIRMVSVKNQDTVTKIIDMVPDVLERVKNGFEKEKANKEARKAVDEAMEEAAEEAE